MSDEPTPASVGAAYDAVAERYTQAFADELESNAPERWILDRFADACRQAGNEPIVDLGCGPGRITAHLSRAGNRVLGVDLSAEMIRIARQRCPDLEFREEPMLDYLRAKRGSVGHALFWYSVIHTPPDRLPELVDATAEALREGGYVLLGFQSMEDPAASPLFHDHLVAPAYRYSLADIRRLLVGAGLEVVSLGMRAPSRGERVHAGYAFGRKPVAEALPGAHGMSLL